MIADIISIITGVCSIGLAVYAIHFAKKESFQSAENYKATEELLKRIEKVALSNQRDIGYANDGLKNL